MTQIGIIGFSVLAIVLLAVVIPLVITIAKYRELIGQDQRKNNQKIIMGSLSKKENLEVVTDCLGQAIDALQSLRDMAYKEESGNVGRIFSVGITMLEQAQSWLVHRLYISNDGDSKHQFFD